RARNRGGVFAVSLVGYTNAGKSTLFNRLTRSGVYAADQLFATLDTVSRRLWLPEAGPVVLSDTVGFIERLPHSLVAAFHATLEEAVEADLLLHVVDAAHPERARQIQAVERVLAEIGAAE
ncbi:MAG: 50S ribosome-binding GTPase, partial [Candidatus Bipolaricaulota bacterium]|nr:50S ribosome-binding GTPase [Candidatus Bipolaricaulota bacterium]